MPFRFLRRRKESRTPLAEKLFFQRLEKRGHPEIHMVPVAGQAKGAQKS